MKIEQQDFKRIRDYMMDNFGINLEHKMVLIEGRLSNLVLKSGFKDFHSYFEHVLKDRTGEQIDLLVNKLTTNYTFFMREEQNYKFLMNTVLPEWREKHGAGELKIWSAGCSSGEEPYTIGITVLEYQNFVKRTWGTRILATDISENVLNQAKNAVYNENQVKNMEPAVLHRYFVRTGEGKYQVADRVRDMVKFEKLNLMSDFHNVQRKYHVIFCRNVMIYFTNDTKEKLANKFYDTLEPGGFLFIGLSETLHNIDTRFEFVKPAIYRKKYVQS
jgi:chemotaxis protein methyltransferase CheR